MHRLRRGGRTRANAWSSMSLAQIGAITLLGLLLLVVAGPPPADAKRPQGLIVFTSDRGGHSDLWTMRADGSTQVRLTNDKVEDVFPTWSPDGTKISFTSDRSGVCAVYTMSPNGSNVQKLTPDSMRAGVAAWSPDGSRLIFSDNFCATTEADLFVMNADGSGVVQVTSSPENELSKSWSPSGDKVVADFAILTGNSLHKGDIAVVTVADGATTNLTNTSGIHEEHPEWSR
jgi:Tol biopolymer transport system component